MLDATFLEILWFFCKVVGALFVIWLVLACIHAWMYPCGYRRW